MPTGKITLRELKASKLTPVFLNTFVNVEKYLEYEQRDPVAATKVSSDYNIAGQASAQVTHGTFVLSWHCKNCE